MAESHCTWHLYMSAAAATGLHCVGVPTSPARALTAPFSRRQQCIVVAYSTTLSFAINCILLPDTDGVDYQIYTLLRPMACAWRQCTDATPCMSMAFMVL